jgi:hypothetical protein
MNTYPGAVSNYKMFIKKHNLCPFNIEKIRTTGAQISNMLSGDDVKTTQALLNHLSVDTTDAYTIAGARVTEALSLSDQIEKRNWFVKTNGARDPRGQPTAPQSAVTPGFVCADPFNPPSYLEQEDGLCAAYGRCPTCPLAGADFTCPTSLALMLRIRTQIASLHTVFETNPYRWSRIWKPELEALDTKWLPKFPDYVFELAQSEIRDVHVAPFPDLLWD